ncbi:MAG: hypothetical protein GF388_10890 [Candidatus Aegiribacteria sp.]|nr:hypothetical protein [Candidatus Aegiribacteria sp.]
MSIKIDYKPKHGVSNLMQKAKKFGKDNGVEVKGNNKSGTVRKGGLLPVKGKYNINGDKITIEVTQIPFLVSWGKARSEILKWLKENDVK